MIYFLSPVPPSESTSGGTRKLGDLSCILSEHGFSSRVVLTQDLAGIDWADNDLVVVPEIYGHGLDTLIPRGVPRVSFIQNAYLLDSFGMDADRPHPYLDTPDLIAIFVESEHSAALLRLRFPTLQLPVIHLHSSGNGRMGRDAGFTYGAWPRRPAVMFFGYKHSAQNAAIFEDVRLPLGWSVEQLGGTDAQVAESLRTGAIFCAPNAIEGLCAPTQEAMLSGCAIVAWPGGPSHFAHHPCPTWAWQQQGGGPMEYLEGRAVIVAQDDVNALRDALDSTARSIEADWQPWATNTAIWAEWHQRTYSRAQEIAEICAVMDELHGRR